MESNNFKFHLKCVLKHFSAIFCFSSFIFTFCYSVQKQLPRGVKGVLKKGVLKNFAKFKEKHLCQSLFFNKFEGIPQK